MKRTLVALLLLSSAVSIAVAQDSLSVHLKPLAPFVGKTWKGVFRQSTAENPQIDVARWERALNGRAVRILHSVNDGAYGGETIVVWDAKRESLVFSYFTTAGFFTTGTAWFEDGVLVTHESVTGDAGGITEVRGTSAILPDGTMRAVSRYFQNGAWVDGHEILYREDASARVVFR